MLASGLALLLAFAPPPDPADGDRDLPIDVVDDKQIENPGYLNIATLPWSRVYIDGRYRGVTPLARVALKPGRHQLRFLNEASGIEAVQEVVINASETTWVRRGLSKGNIGKKLTWVAQAPPEPGSTGVLRLETTPTTRVWIDGEERGQTPLSVRLTAGKRFVWLVNEYAGIEAAKRIEVQPGTETAVSLQLEPGSGFVEIDPGLKAEVIIDDEPRGQTPLKLKLTCGPHALIVRNAAAGLELKQTLHIRLGETTRVELALTARTDLERDRVEEDPGDP